ncbi:hypothetical protein Cni_G21898 [Canna indica]|uniref:Uncharacterized protein n=1 Tax=Canna indica TaxID=4628 RepID=A0AAQ3KRJ9_9LILI|nr:hypothetical protein Cni_G21898 [Canna indica]
MPTGSKFAILDDVIFEPVDLIPLARCFDVPSSGPMGLAFDLLSSNPLFGADFNGLMLSGPPKPILTSLRAPRRGRPQKNLGPKKQDSLNAKTELDKFYAYADRY